MTIREELIAFGITSNLIRNKIQEHADNCANLHVEIASFKSDNKTCTPEQVVVNNLAIKNLETLLEKERAQIRKWKGYENALQGKEIKQGSITDYDIQNARDYDIVSLVSLDLDLRKVGSRYYACCPFHAENTPSFYIKDNFFYCFGCGEHGNSIDWCVKYKKMTFTEAVKYLAS